ncbi:hypothetical protein BDW75DRAFT_205227, partial [Aspergillus navahoensis]
MALYRLYLMMLDNSLPATFDLILFILFLLSLSARSWSVRLILGIVPRARDRTCLTSFR